MMKFSTSFVGTKSLRHLANRVTRREEGQEEEAEKEKRCKEGRKEKTEGGGKI